MICPDCGANRWRLIKTWRGMAGPGEVTHGEAGQGMAARGAA